MSRLGSNVGKKAARATVKHSARGLASKAQRKPLRSAALLSVGAVVGGAAGLTAGWLVGRKGS